MTNTASDLRRTSITDPLIITEIPHGNLTIGITCCPGRKGKSMSGTIWDRDLGADLEVIRDWGPDTIVTMGGMEDFGLGYHHPGPYEQDRSNIIKNVAQLFEVEPRPLISRYSLVLDEKFSPGGDLPEIMVDKAFYQGGRILFISPRGLERAGALAAAALRRTGMDVEAAIQMVNGRKPGSITTIAQREFLGAIETLEQTSIKQKKRLEREKQPPGIQVVKSELREGEKRSAGLERIAKREGFKNWSTMHAALSGPGRPWPVHDQFQDDLHRKLALDTQDPEAVVAALWEAVALDSRAVGGDMWARRAYLWIDACVYAIFDYHRSRNVQVSFRDLRHGITLESFDRLFRGYASGEFDGAGRGKLISFAETIPGWSRGRAMMVAKQQTKTQEQVGYITMQLTKPLGEIGNR
ncbi:MAG: hypothetical protein ABJN42_26955 [Roseibium sp.]|uniref:hypothetical protein n=1 Tax=Roseibium sp. TaxID=1936156 RepID=UPI003297B35F